MSQHDDHGHVCTPACWAGMRGEAVNPAPEERIDGFVERSILNAVLGGDLPRRRFLKAMGSSALLAMISQWFPLDDAKAMAKEGGALEKKDLSIGFIPITCATPMRTIASARLPTKERPSSSITPLVTSPS